MTAAVNEIRGRETMKKVVVIGCDNAAVHMKNEFKIFIEEMGYTVEDAGCSGREDPVYYPHVAEKVCENIIASGYTKEGVLICGTGLGMAMTANKFPGIRAGVCHDIYSGERLKLSNDGNVICFGERVIGVELAKKILEKWLSLEFIPGASAPKVAAILEVEKETMKMPEGR